MSNATVTELPRSRPLIESAPDCQMPVERWGSDAAVQQASAMSQSARQKLERLAYTWSNATEAYDLATVDGRVLRTPCGTGAVRVITDGHFWHIPGGLLGPETARRQMIDWLHDVAREQGVNISVYSVPSSDADAFLAGGFEVSKLGEEAVLPLGEIDWHGKQFDWVRRQTNFCRRAGLKVIELSSERDRHVCADMLLKIQSDDLAGRPYSNPIQILEADFNPRRLGRRRVFVARADDTGEIEGFLSCAPMQAGRQWAFETYRKAHEATRGVIAFLFREVIDRLQIEGAEQVSLCIVPGRGVASSQTRHDNWWKRKILTLWYGHMNWLFNIRGQEQFKSHFHPEFIDRYVCVTPRTTVGSFLSFLRKSGAAYPSLLNIARSLKPSRFRRT